MKRFWFVLAALLGLAVQAVPASADMVYTLNCNDAPCVGGAAGHNYGTVTLQTVSSTQVRVIVDLAAPGAVANERFASSAAGYAIAWDIAGDPALTNVTINTAGTPNPSHFAVQPFGANNTYKASPFTSGSNGKDFNYAIDHTSGADTKLVFDVTLSTGLTLGSFVNNNNYFFAVDISINGNTFNVAANQPGVKVPEPQTWTLSIAGMAGLAGLVMLRRRRKEARAA
jgi:MYXO-CTERM domain-containing protein